MDRTILNAIIKHSRGIDHIYIYIYISFFLGFGYNPKPRYTNAPNTFHISGVGYNARGWSYLMLCPKYI